MTDKVEQQVSEAMREVLWVKYGTQFGRDTMEDTARAAITAHEEALKEAGFVIVKTTYDERGWIDKVRAERQRLNREPTLDELLALAKSHDMTPSEIEAQRASWTRQDID